MAVAAKRSKLSRHWGPVLGTGAAGLALGAGLTMAFGRDWAVQVLAEIWPSPPLLSDSTTVSAALLSEVPESASELNIIRNGKLARSFSAYEEHPRGAIEAEGRRLRRIIYRWNGRIYSKAN